MRVYRIPSRDFLLLCGQYLLLHVHVFLLGQNGEHASETGSTSLTKRGPG